MDGPIPRLTPFGEIDNLRENWWCGDVGGDVVEINFEKDWQEDGKGTSTTEVVPASGYRPAHVEAVPSGPALPSVGFPAFLNAAEKQRAAVEWDKLRALGSASHYLPRVVIDWAKKHPNDPRDPEALYLAIRAMRYGSSNELSHEAFLLLHQNYPQSEWAKKTPYWFK